VLGSPLIALTLPDRFDKYIFCEEKENLLSALKTRCATLAPNVRPAFISGECNEMVPQVLSEIPIGSNSRTVLTLCFVDPYNLVGVNFDMLKQFSARYVDFLCLLALDMDANRNYERYITEDAPQVDKFLGYTEWREKWREAQWQGIDFPDFLASEFSDRMRTLGYLPTPPYLMKRVRSDEKNLPLYHLALFSRSKTAFDFWDDVLKYSTDQQNLF
jgi:three-Cys-motif partner protein